MWILQKSIALSVKSIEDFKNAKITYAKTLFHSILCYNCGSKDEKISKEEESV